MNKAILSGLLSHFGRRQIWNISLTWRFIHQSVRFVGQSAGRARVKRCPIVVTDRVCARRVVRVRRIRISDEWQIVPYRARNWERAEGTLTDAGCHYRQLRAGQFHGASFAVRLEFWTADSWDDANVSLFRSRVCLMSAFCADESLTGRPRRVVAVDARTLTQTGKGVPRFLSETLRVLAGRDDLRFVLFSNRPLHPDHDLPIDTIIDDGWRRVPGTLWMMARLNALALRVGADTVWGPAHVLPPRHTGLRSVLTVHDLVYRIMPESMGTWNRWVSTWLVEASIHRADRIVAVSEATRNDMLRLVCPSRTDIQVAYMGVGVTRPRDAPRERNHYLFALGSIEPRKNIDGLLRCFMRLRERCPELTLRLTGAHSWGASETLAAIARDPACEILGFVSDAELATQMAGARAFVMPSHYEGFGLPVIEAVGLAPVIAADIPVFRELARFVEGVQFVDFDDPDAAAGTIASFLATDPAPARFVGGARDKFRWRSTAECYADVFLRGAMDAMSR